ncbi:MAG: peptidoglycan-binding domain-containing protein [Candidatus Omnitrophica bacterium]|nr:peptidoglycan-binding domain-containing protein [Candidatus Omnitrophota bacterium]
MPRVTVVILTALILLPLAFYGCKSRVEKVPEIPKMESMEEITPSEEKLAPAVTEPAQIVATETIPPTAAPQVMEKPAAERLKIKPGRNIEVQMALAKAGFYTGPIDGKIGPKSKRAIVEFQKAKGLKPDGKVGPLTWAELEKYLTR